METFMTNIAIPFSMLLFLVAALACVAFPLFHFIKGVIPKKAIKSFAVVVVGGIALYAIGYLLGGSPDQEYLELRNVSASTYKNVGAGLTVMYILTALAFIGIIITEVKSFIK